MLQTTGALNVSASPPVKSISAVKKYARSKTPKQRNARVAWKRIKENIDDLVAKTGANPELGSVISRWVLFGHITRSEAYAARLYGEIVGTYDRLYADTGKRSAKSPSYQRGTAGAIDILERHRVNGTIADFEREVKKARKNHARVMKILARFPLAKDKLDDVCLNDVEIASELRPHLKVVLRLLGQEFGVIPPDRKPEDK